VANIIVVVDQNRDFVLCGCFDWVAEKYMWPKSIWPSLAQLRSLGGMSSHGHREHPLVKAHYVLQNSGDNHAVDCMSYFADLRIIATKHGRYLGATS
jgi:hypothetical protein